MKNSLKVESEEQSRKTLRITLGLQIPKTAMHTQREGSNPLNAHNSIIPWIILNEPVWSNLFRIDLTLVLTTFMVKESHITGLLFDQFHNPCSLGPPKTWRQKPKMKMSGASFAESTFTSNVLVTQEK